MTEHWSCDKFFELLAIFDNEKSQEALIYLHDNYHELLHNGYFDQANAVLSLVDIEKLPPVIIVAFLMVTFRFRNYLIVRDEFFHRAKILHPTNESIHLIGIHLLKG